MIIIKAKAKAHTNIALIKYWGKKDEKLALPANSSLSLTLEAFYTKTEVEFKKGLKEDILYIDGRKDDKSLKRVSNFLDIFRKKANLDLKAKITSFNHVPFAAGLASSSSAFAALAKAANKASGLNLNKEELSKIVRKGSGSACRSLYNGFVQWKKGEDDKSSYAYPIDSANWDLAMIVILVNKEEKKISSRKAMKITKETSPFFQEWTKEAEKDLISIKKAIKNKDLKSVGEIMEANALKMHATMIAAKPSIIYFQDKTLKAIEIVKKVRNDKLLAFFTIDAGPNVKVLCHLSQASRVKEYFLNDFKEEEIIVSKIKVGKSDEWKK